MLTCHHVLTCHSESRRRQMSFTALPHWATIVSNQFAGKEIMVILMGIVVTSFSDCHRPPGSSPMVSGKPAIRLKFWMATPDAPLIRLSRHAMIMTRPLTMRTVISQKLV